MAKKYILVNGELRIGDVERHEDLKRPDDVVTGGGLWHIDTLNRKIYLYGASTQFPVVRREDIIKAVEAEAYPKELNDFTFYHWLDVNLKEVIEKAVPINLKAVKNNQ